MPSDRLPPPPPVPRDECPTVAPPRDPECDAIVRELEALRASLRDVCCVPTCECCGARAGEPGVYCGCELPATTGEWEMF